MADQLYQPGDLVLVRDQYQPLNPIPAVVEGYSAEPPKAPHLVKVRYRESATVHWIDAGRIIGPDDRARQVSNGG